MGEKIMGEKNTNENNLYVNSIEQMSDKKITKSIIFEHFGVVAGPKTTPDVAYMTGRSENVKVDNTEDTNSKNNNTEER